MIKVQYAVARKDFRAGPWRDIVVAKGERRLVLFRSEGKVMVRSGTIGSFGWSDEKDWDFVMGNIP